MRRWHGAFHAKVTAYLMNIVDRIMWLPNDGSALGLSDFVCPPRNLNDVRSQGVELAVRGAVWL
jgi:hypothetical protein